MSLGTMYKLIPLYQYQHNSNRGIESILLQIVIGVENSFELDLRFDFNYIYCRT
jgi:hypothetical protein